MPETAMKNESPIPDRSQLGPRLRVGRGRIYRHAIGRGSAAGLWTTLPIAVMLWEIGPGDPRTAFLSVSLIVVGLVMTATYHWLKVRRRWPRIWDSTLTTPALVETVLHCHGKPVGQSWNDALRARSSQIPLPTATALRRLAPLPSPVLSLSLTLLALLLGSWHATISKPVVPATEQSLARSATTAVSSGENESNRQRLDSADRLHSREDAALALVGRSQLTRLSEHLRSGSAISAPTSALSPRDRQALQSALGRLQDSDPRRQALEQWLAADRLLDGGPVLPIEGLQASGEAIGRDPTAGVVSGSPSAELADGGRDVPDRLEPTSEAAAGIEPGDQRIHLTGGTDSSGEISTSGRSPSASPTSSSWDRVRDDPRLESRWIEVIDRYLNLLQAREQNGGR